ncbi:MAG: DUF4294 domain-containing protein [Saprospiraceae bacterium]|nr:DUF4294 domain-containing protein [Saprospiraceae bacterium]
MKWSFAVLLVLFGLANLQGQEDGYALVNGKYFPYTIDECGDTLILASLGGVSISAPRTFTNAEDQKRYRRYRRYALKVYPYAVEAIKIFREMEEVTNDMKRRDRKKHIRRLHKQLKKEFTDPLKKLTKTQGMILMKMIEKELDKSMFKLIKDLRGGWNANYWSAAAGMFGHKLKKGYIPGQDPVLDAVLNDLDISYQISRN